jgi:hypothetical protein
MRSLLREWGFPVAVITAWWFGLVWALSVAMAPKPEPVRADPPRPPAVSKVASHRS